MTPGGDRPPRFRGLDRTEVHSLTVWMRGTEILHEVNLTLNRGELAAVVGPNGGGKSTFFQALLGLVKYEGSVRFLNRADMHLEPRIGYVPQKLDMDRLSPVTVLDVCAAALSRRPVFLPVGGPLRRRVEDCLRLTGAEELIDRRLGALSGGELQRALLALALSEDPELLLLDEPVSGVDAAGLRIFQETLAELKCRGDLTILLISHDFDGVMRLADRAVLLNREVLADGSPAEVLASEAFRGQFGFLWKGDRG